MKLQYRNPPTNSENSLIDTAVAREDELELQLAHEDRPMVFVAASEALRQARQARYALEDAIFGERQ